MIDVLGQNSITLEFAIIDSQRIIGGIFTLYRFGHYGKDSPPEKEYRATKNPFTGEHRLLYHDRGSLWRQRGV